MKCVFFFSKLKVKGHGYGIKDGRCLSPSVPRSPTSSEPRTIYNRPAATTRGPMSHCSACEHCARTLACCDRWRTLRLRPAADAFFNAPPSAALLIALILPSSDLFSANIAPPLSGLISLKDEGNVSSVTVTPSIGDVIDKGRLSF